MNYTPLFGPDDETTTSRPLTWKDITDAVDHEVERRARYYRQRVRDGQLKVTTANYEHRCMCAVQALLRSLPPTSIAGYT